MGIKFIVRGADFSKNGMAGAVNIKSTLGFVIGNIDGVGHEFASNKQIRSKAFKADKNLSVSLDWSKYKIYAFEWGDTGEAFSQYLSEKRDDFVLPKGKYYRLVVTSLEQNETVNSVETFGGYTSLYVG